MKKAKRKPRVRKDYSELKNTVLKSLITDDSKECIIKFAKKLYKDKDKCMAILTQMRMDEIAIGWVYPEC